MFKKTCLTCAVLGAFSLGAAAAEVQLYGVVDLGLIYTNSDFSLNEALQGDDVYDLNQDGFKLDSGINAGSRIGIKGSESLGNGYTVSFKLENGFDADDGSLSDDDRLFNREASLTLAADWGKLSVGRMGALSAAAGSYDVVMAIGDAFDGGDGIINGLVGTSRYDNMIVYQSPKVAGLQVTAEYSLKTDNKIDEEAWGAAAGREGHRDAQRYVGLALTGEYGILQGVVAYEQILESNKLGEDGPENMVLLDLDDAKLVSVGGNADFGFVKAFAMAQYAESWQFEFDTPIPEIGAMSIKGFDGWATHLGAQAPLAGGLMTAGLYYREAEFTFPGEETIDDINWLGGSVKYEYPLSARTSLYGSVGYAQMEGDVFFDKDLTQAYFGLTHNF